VDALWQGEPRSVDNPPIYVELKTSKEIRSDNDALAFERKMLRFWFAPPLGPNFMNTILTIDTGHNPSSSGSKKSSSASVTATASSNPSMSYKLPPSPLSLRKVETPGTGTHV